MQPSEAIAMLEPAGWIHNTPQVWADFGCGKGIFTVALSSLLPTGSTVYAIDREPENLRFVPGSYKGVHIHTIHADFTSAGDLPPLDGILMANSLHYVRDKDQFGQMLRGMLKEDGRLLVVEYDTDNANRWVPFPVSFVALEKWASKLGFRNVTRLKERTSIYQRSKMYSAVSALKTSGMPSI